MVSFQCSPLSTPEGIVGTFKQCAEFQKAKDLDRFVSVVVLDGIGLAEDSPRMPLNVGTCIKIFRYRYFFFKYHNVDIIVSIEISHCSFYLSQLRYHSIAITIIDLNQLCQLLIGQ